MKLKIQKYNPAVDDAPYIVEGDVEWHDGITALDAIYLFSTKVQPIHFEYSCGGRFCGRCAAMVDGEPKLICTALLSDATHTIEPLTGYPIIRDLMVDKSAFDDAYTAISQRVMPEPVTMETFVPEDYAPDALFDLRWKGERCARCGMCNTVCPALQAHGDEYVGPALMYAIGFRHLDWYDKADRVAQAVSSGLYYCIQCGKCDEVCTSFVPHAEMWKLLRGEAEERGLVPKYAEG